MFRSISTICFARGTLALHNYVEDSNDCVDFNGLKTYRRKNGQFGKKPERKKKHDSSHGNSNDGTVYWDGATNSPRGIKVPIEVLK